MKRHLFWVFVAALTVAGPTKGPLHAQDPRDAWIDLLAAGNVEEGRDQLVIYAGGLPPVEATHVLRWVEAISLTEGDDQQAVAQAIVLAQRSEPADAATLLTERVADREDEAAGVLISLAIRMADRASQPEAADALRARLIEDFFGHAVTPEALLALAEHRLATGAPVADIAGHVEALIVDQPTHPLVPTARRLLERLRESGSGS